MIRRAGRQLTRFSTVTIPGYGSLPWGAEGGHAILPRLSSGASNKGNRGGSPADWPRACRVVATEMAQSPLESRFVNYLEIGHNDAEFVLAFGQHYADQEDPVVHTSLVTNPVYAKEFCKLLTKSIEDYEAAYRQKRTGE